MVEAVMFWNEPNNKSHWDFAIDPGWTIFSAMVRQAAEAVAAERPRLTRVMGGISPIDPSFIRTLQNQRAFDRIDAVAVHGFPLDWNHWQIDEWRERLNEVRAVTALTFCFTPESRGIEPHHTSPPQVTAEFADFCARQVRRYA